VPSVRNDLPRTGLAQPARPPKPGDVHTRGERGVFHGTNPWSGPYYVIGIAGTVLVIVVAILVAAIVGLIRGH